MSKAPAERRLSVANPPLTLADAVTGCRLVLLPFLVYALAQRLAGLGAGLLAAVIVSDLIDGRIARLMPRVRNFGGAFDSAIDFVVIYVLFTVLFIIGLLPWWKWAVILVTGLLMAVTQTLYAVSAGDIVFAPTVTAKLVGQIQYVYLLLLTARRFWLTGEWVQLTDHAVFALLALAIAVNTRRQTILLFNHVRARALRSGRTAHVPSDNI